LIVYRHTIKTYIIVVGILIAGGLGAKTSTEVFLPGTGQTCTLADLPDPRYDHTLNTLDNSGVLCGGGNGGDAMPSCLQFSITTGVIIITIYIVCTQPVSGTWTSYGAALQEERYGHTSWVSPAGLVIMGGIISGSGTTTEIVNGGMNFTLVQRTM
jgi:hypothetical protein